MTRRCAGSTSSPPSTTWRRKWWRNCASMPNAAACWRGSGWAGSTAASRRAVVYLRVRNEMLSAEREVFVRMRDSGDLDDDVLRRVQAELDLEQALLARRAEVERLSEETELPTRELSQPRCRHLRDAPLTVEPRSAECEDCVAEGRADWVHLRACLDCGHTGCCDSSPRRHARWHYEQTAHPVMRSAEPGEAWRWCYVDRELG